MKPHALGVLAAFALAGGAVAAPVSFPERDGLTDFVTPSGNIGCTYVRAGGTTTYEPIDGGPELQCDRVEPSYVRAVMGPRGKASVSHDVGEQSCCGTGPVLGYGQTWSKGGFTCVSQESGLTCTRGPNGFTLSRKAVSGR